jgi:antitoxin component of RelBE/YafQ-DinJ toxin-antitoxin module
VPSTTWRAEDGGLDMMLSLRLPSSVVEAVDAISAQLGASRTDVLRLALYRVTPASAWPRAAGTLTVDALSRELAER